MNTLLREQQYGSYGLEWDSFTLHFERCRRVVVKRVDSEHRACEFKSYMCHDKNTIGEESNGNPPHKVHFPGKKL